MSLETRVSAGFRELAKVAKGKQDFILDETALEAYQGLKNRATIAAGRSFDYDPTGSGADGVLTVAAPGKGGGAWRARVDRAVNLRDYVKVPSGQNATSQVQKAVNYCIATGRSLYVPSGPDIRVANVLINNSLTIFGDSNRSIFALAEDDAYCFVIDTLNQTCLRDVFMVSPPTYGLNTGGLYVTGGNSYSIIDNCFFLNCQQSIHLHNAAFQTIKNNRFLAGQYGVWVENQPHPDGGDSIIEKNKFRGNSLASIFYKSSGGLMVYKNKFLPLDGVENGVAFNMSLAPGAQTVDLFIQQNSIESYTSYGIILQMGAGSQFYDVLISQNQIVDYSTNPTNVNIALNGDGGTLENVFITDNILKTKGDAIYANNVNGFLSTDNIIDSFPSLNLPYTRAHNLTASVTNHKVFGNVQKRQALPDILPNGDGTNLVSYGASQSLSSGQKAQARTNIGALGTSDLKLSAVTAASGVQYAPILSLPGSSGASYDGSLLIVSLGGYSSNAKKVLTLNVGQRDAFIASAVCQGDNSSPGKVVAYRNADASTTLYIVVDSFMEVGVFYVKTTQATPVSALTFTSTTPTGTLIYDSSTTLPILEAGQDSLKTKGNKVAVVTPVVVLTSSATGSPNTKYVANSSSLITITLPADSAIQVGEQVSIRGMGTGGWRLAQNAGQVIHGASDTTTGTGGYVQSQSRYDTVVVEKIAANEFSIVANRGTLTII
ncbi:right-handed parallel beta-helix repeat-containing protein [Spirosoma sordidisoli]|uniref:Right-handed parallel beta-helix repeat-containing protein n=1 Tax=Spirosoma sordidisoli TaxID=2502893 RepID=A0A4Q2UM41_9BACT|nr:right-handed parallel beta-helix repeat-containing protein [Spirosoma sordidisoli]RYC70653.1 right-handed parallel beta-helix repeat-containing protein [Spirosoma sordidisoli]